MGGGSGENNRPASSHWQTLPHAVVSSTAIYKTIYDGGRLTTIVDRYGTDSAYLYDLGICVLCFNWPIKKWDIFREKGLMTGSYTQFCIFIKFLILFFISWPLYNICFANAHGYFPLVVITSQSFPYSWFSTGFVRILTRQVRFVKQELPTLPDRGSCSAIFCFMCIYCR